VIPTKQRRGRDQLGRSRTAVPSRLLSLTLFAMIVGSPWPISARSLDPACDKLSAFARRPQHRSYRPCQDQLLRKLLPGLQLKHRGSGSSEPA
jgi:hypothetical protein